LWPYRQQRALRQDPWKHIERSPLSAVSSPETIMLQRQATDELGRILSALSPREERVLRFRFGIGCHEATLDEVATMFSVTRERIRQIEGKALRRLKHRRLSPRVSQCYEVLVA
jgi:RNA polymerase primary sigma factor